MSKFSFVGRILSAALFCLSLDAGATVISGTSSAYGESVYLTIAPRLGGPIIVSSGPFPSAAGSAPLPYDVMNTLASINIGGFLSTGVLTAHAASNVDGTPGSKSTSAEATVDNLSALLGTLRASVIQATANVNGDYGTLQATGGTTLAGLFLGGLPLANVSPAPNTVLLDALGLTITLNEQITSGDGISSLGLAVNAIDIDFKDFVAGIGLINGYVTISHAESLMTARPDRQEVPEPATMLLFGAGLMGLTATRRKGNGARK